MRKKNGNIWVSSEYPETMGLPLHFLDDFGVPCLFEETPCPETWTNQMKAMLSGNLGIWGSKGARDHYAMSGPNKI
jgi:hypothetical protein